MANVMKISGPASALLLLAALLAAGARAYTIRAIYTSCAGGRIQQDTVDREITWLTLSLCEITSIPQDQLYGLPELRSLWLPYNKLRELPVFEEHVCANLTELNLNHNQLTGIYNAKTSACTKLEVLYLAENHIQFIDTSVFTALTELTGLSLQKNMIRYIPDQLLASNGKLKWLRLDGNRITHLPPEFASRLKRAGAGLDAFHFHNNPWHCACLIELLADVKRAGVGDYDEYKQAYDGGAPVCVYTDGVPCCRRAPTGLLRAARGRGRGRGGR